MIVVHFCGDLHENILKEMAMVACCSDGTDNARHLGARQCGKVVIRASEPTSSLDIESGIIRVSVLSQSSEHFVLKAGMHGLRARAFQGTCGFDQPLMPAYHG